jgi:Nucleoside-diphosphate-sugar epimerases
VTLFLIGGTGFIGRHVTRHLAARGHAVTVFHRGETTPDLPSSVESVRGNRDDTDALRTALDAAAPDVVLDVIPYTEAQADALVEVCAGRTDRIVVLSSGDVYRQYDGLRPERSEEVVSGLRGHSDRPPDPVPLMEDAPLRASRYPYRGSGADFEYAHDYDKILVEHRVRAGAVPATILRLPKVYGPGDGQHHVGEALARLRGAEGALVLGEKQARWRWSRGHVENVAVAIGRAVTSDAAAGRTYNVGEPDALPEATWLRRVAAAAGIDATIRTAPDEQVEDQPPFDWRYAMATDTRRIRTELGVAEPVGHAEALKRTIAWERES